MVTPDGKPDLGMITRQVQNLFRYFYNQMDFSPEQRLAITKVIIELTDPSGGSSLVKRRPQQGGKFEGNSLTFFESDAQGLLSHYKRPMHVTASIRDAKLQRTMVDT